MHSYLVPEIETREDGAGPGVVPETPPTGELVVTVGITQALEREKLRVSIWGSPDGENWGAKPLLEFPAKSYCGRYSIPLDLRQRPEVRHLRAAWNVLTWNPAHEALFRFYVVLSEAAPKAMAAAAAHA